MWIVGVNNVAVNVWNGESQCIVHRELIWHFEKCVKWISRDGGRRCENGWNQWKMLAILTSTNSFLFCTCAIKHTTQSVVYQAEYTVNQREANGETFFIKSPVRFEIESVAVNKQFKAVIVEHKWTICVCVCLRCRKSRATILTNVMRKYTYIFQCTSSMLPCGTNRSYEHHVCICIYRTKKSMLFTVPEHRSDKAPMQFCPKNDNEIL